MTIAIPLVFLVAFIPRFLAAYKIDMTWDEGLYALNGLLSIKNVAELNFSSTAWSFEFHPPVMMYLYGIVYGAYTFVKSILRYGFSVNYKRLYREGIRLFRGRQTLLIIRLPSVILGSLSCVLVYLLSLHLLGNESIGIIAALFLALTPLFLAWSSLAVLESGVTFFSLLMLWLLLRAVEYNNLGCFILSGISLGLTLGCKATGWNIPLATLPWLVMELLRRFVADGLSAGMIFSLSMLTWITVGLFTFYIAWPWLWRDPLGQFMKNVRAVREMTSEKGGGWSFYTVQLLASTPLVLAVLYGIGFLETAQLMIRHTNLLLLLSWVILSLILMSMPFVPKRGGAYELIFVLPPLSILAGLGTHKMSKLLTSVGGEFISDVLLVSSEEAMLLLLTSVFMSIILVGLATVYPHSHNYYNPVVKMIGKVREKFPVWWWGEGMAGAMAYIDEHAPPNSTVWIYGPKSTAFYHSGRGDLKKSFEDDHLFYALDEKGLDTPDTSDVFSAKSGDLQFYFPYYQPDKEKELDIIKLREENVSYILIYRWAIHSPSLTTLKEGDRKIISTLRRHYTPVFTAKIRDTEVCWVYKVSELDVRMGLGE